MLQIGLFIGLSAAALGSELDRWSQTGLTFARVAQELNDEQCQLSEDTYLGCVHAMQKGLDFFNHKLWVFPAATKQSEFGPEFVASMDSSLVRLQDALVPNVAFQFSSSTSSVRKQLNQTWKKAYRSKVPFSLQHFMEALPLGLSNPNQEAAAAGAMYSAFLAHVFDPHAMLVPATQAIEEARVDEGVEWRAERWSKDTLYLRIPSFQRVNTAGLVRAALDSAFRPGDRILLDLRGNAGGLESAAADTANLFLPIQSVVHRTMPLEAPRIGRAARFNQLLASGKNASAQEADGYSCVEAQVFTGPVFLLVNSGTASSAEIFAGALQFHDRALLIGERTFGKGLLQSPLDSPFGPQLLVFRSRRRVIFPDSIHSFHGVGLTPEIGVSAFGLGERPESLREFDVFPFPSIRSGPGFISGRMALERGRAITECVQAKLRRTPTASDLESALRSSVACLR